MLTSLATWRGSPTCHPETCACSLGHPHPSQASGMGVAWGTRARQQRACCQPHPASAAASAKARIFLLPGFSLWRDRKTEIPEEASV